MDRGDFDKAAQVQYFAGFTSHFVSFPVPFLI